MTRLNSIPRETTDAVSLREAFREHTPTELMERYEKILNYRGKTVSLWSTEPPPSLFIRPQQTMGGRQTRQLFTGQLFVAKEARASLQEIEAAGLFGKLRRGELTAWGRIGSPLGPWEQPPAEAWAALWIDDLDAGTVKGEGAALFDVRVGGPAQCTIERPSEPRPAPLPDRDLNRCLGDLMRQQPHGALAPTLTELQEHVKRKHPYHHVARKRVRDWLDANVSPENRRRPGQKAAAR